VSLLRRASTEGMPVDQRGTMTDDTHSVTDPIDWARFYWSRRDFTGDPTRFLAMSSLLRYQRLVQLKVESTLREVGLQQTDFMLLMSLELSKQRTWLVGALARTLMVHATTATLAVDRLEARGLLTRRAHPQDRRAVMVSISQPGSDLVHDAMVRLESVGFGFVNARDSDVEKLLQALSRVRHAAGDA
jgi:DNA-binding MarR family transcriptional regulator